MKVSPSSSSTDNGQNHENGSYNLTKSSIAIEALHSISNRLQDVAALTTKTTTTEQSTEQASTQSQLKLVSMNECLDSGLLTKFYNELMIPNFPLDDERDDLDDWLYCFQLQQQQQQQQHQPSSNKGPTMDVLLLILHQDNNEATIMTTTTTTIDNNRCWYCI